MQATAEAAAKLRAERGLRPLQAAEQGTSVRDLPPGVYGFTYSPAFEATPLFAQRSWRSFEFHKLADGTVAIVGYVTAADANIVNENGPARVTLYPDAWNDANQLVSIPLDRMAHSSRPPARDEGFPYAIELV